MADAVATTFAGTGETSSITVTSATASLSGTFVGTVKLQAMAGTTWVDIPDGSFTAPTIRVIEFTTPTAVRWNCSAYTSGSPYAEIKKGA